MVAFLPIKLEVCSSNSSTAKEGGKEEGSEGGKEGGRKGRSKEYICKKFQCVVIFVLCAVSSY
jgi:hypothetical protein